MWISSHTLPLTPSVELTCLIPCQQSLHVDMEKKIAMKKVDARKNLPKKGCACGTPPPTYSNFV